MPATGGADLATVNDYDAIVRVCQLYLDGDATGDVGKLHQAFHPEAWMFGSVGGQRMDVPIEDFIRIASDHPAGAGGQYRGRILSVQQTGDAASAVVAEDGCWGNVSFVDHFCLARIDGVWKIVGKSFFHTGGEMPPGL